MSGDQVFRGLVDDSGFANHLVGVLGVNGAQEAHRINHFGVSLRRNDW